jgi:signal transduction histidine kinase
VHGAALLVLEDDGPGFAPEISLHLFERRVKGTHSNGHGLGLAFVEAVVSAHGGSIEASNQKQGGARLAITLPLAENGMGRAGRRHSLRRQGETDESLA